MIEPETIEPAAESPATEAPAPVEAQSSADDLDRLLSEFDSATATARVAEPEPMQPEPPEAAPYDPLQEAEAAIRVASEMADWQQRGSAAEAQVQQLQQALAEAQHAAWLQKEKADMDAFVKEAEQSIADLPTPEGFAEAFLMSQAVKDEKLRTAWDHRNANLDPWSKRIVQGYLKSAVAKVRKAAETVPDADATATRAAITAAMKGASVRVTADPPPNLGALSDAEFSAYTRKNFGF